VRSWPGKQALPTVLRRTFAFEMAFHVGFPGEVHAPPPMTNIIPPAYIWAAIVFSASLWCCYSAWFPCVGEGLQPRTAAA